MNRRSTTFFLLNIFIRTIIIISRTHWFTIWIGLEIKTISIIPILLKKKKSRTTEASIKYFIIKTVAAAIILKSALIKVWNKGSWLINTKKQLCKTITTIALIIKLGIAPFHLWFPEVVRGVKLTKGLIITTWQKIAPTIIILLIKTKTKLIIVFTTTSIIIRSWKGLKQTKTRKIIAFSSINHIRWIILISIYNLQISLIMLIIYITIKTSIFISLINKKTLKIANAKKKNLIKPWKASILSISLLSLGGLPPLTGFIKKFLRLKILIEKKAKIITIPLIIGRLIRLFFYLRLIFITKMTKFPKNSMLLIKKKKKNQI